VSGHHVADVDLLRPVAKEGAEALDWRIPTGAQPDVFRRSRWFVDSGAIAARRSKIVPKARSNDAT